MSPLDNVVGSHSVVVEVVVVEVVVVDVVVVVGIHDPSFLSSLNIFSS